MPHCFMLGIIDTNENFSQYSECFKLFYVTDSDTNNKSIFTMLYCSMLGIVTQITMSQYSQCFIVLC